MVLTAGFFNPRLSAPGTLSDLRWAWVTLALSAAVVVGYALIAFNWYFQKKVAECAEAKSALRRLRIIVLCSCVFSYLVIVTDVSWFVWRLYDVALFFLAFYTWSSLMKMRGLSLVDQRLAQAQELEHSAQKYREIAELLPHMVWTATADGEVDFSNLRWSEYAGGVHTWLDAVHADERQEVLSWWRKAASERVAVTREVRLSGAAGYRWFIVSATPLIHGDAVKWLGACADIEPQKLLAAQKEMQVRQKAFFLNALSHDLRAPLNVVALNAHLLKLSAREDEQLELANAIVENAVAAGDLVANLLDFSKMGAHITNASDKVSAATLLQQVIRRFQPVADKKGVFLRLDEQRDLQIITDRGKLERIISNLLDNAIKYTERGGVTVKFDAVADAMRIRIIDTGIGVPEQSIPHLFDEFYQVNNQERDRSKGFGMGLAICQSLAKQVGGDVRLASTGPTGSCFEVIVCQTRGDNPARRQIMSADQPYSPRAGACPA